MPPVKSAADIAKKWSKRAATASADYSEGVKDPAVDWEGPTLEAAETYASGVQEAIGRGAFAKGVRNSGGAFWKEKTATMGVERWAPGVRGAENLMAEGMESVVKTIENTKLPPRAPRGDPRNFERARIMAEALAMSRRRA